MFFTNKKRAIEITTRTIRFVEIESGKGGPNLLRTNALDLPQELVSPSFAKTNIGDRELLKSKLSELVPDNVRGGDIALCLPDALVKIAMLRFDTLPSSREEACQLILWRMKKTMPLATDLINLDYRVISTGGEGVNVLTAASPRHMIREYEDLLRELDFLPRVVDVASLGALSLHRTKTKRSMLFINMNDDAVSFIITSGGEIEFFRSKEMAGQPANIEREFAATYRYFTANIREEGVEAIGVCAQRGSAAEIAEQLRRSFGREIFSLTLCGAGVSPTPSPSDEQYSAAVGLAMRL